MSIFDFFRVKKTDSKRDTSGDASAINTAAIGSGESGQPSSGAEQSVDGIGLSGVATSTDTGGGDGGGGGGE